MPKLPTREEVAAKWLAFLADYFTPNLKHNSRAKFFTNLAAQMLRELDSAKPAKKGKR